MIENTSHALCCNTAVVLHLRLGPMWLQCLCGSEHASENIKLPLWVQKLLTGMDIMSEGI